MMISFRFEEMLPKPKPDNTQRTSGFWFRVGYKLLHDPVSIIAITILFTIIFIAIFVLELPL